MSDPDINELKRVVQELSNRVARLEERLGERPVSMRPQAPVVPINAPSFEARVGSQYLNRAGVIALLIGISFFLHWAISNNWIGPGARCVLGLVGGIGVIVLGQWFMRRRYSAFGLSLKALGVGTIYLSLWAAFQLYQLIPLALAALAMIATTIATAMMSLMQESEGLAVLAAIGGFATPVLLSTGADRHPVLFAYLAVLCCGMLFMVSFRPWQKLLIVSFAGCFLVSAVWYYEYFRPPMGTTVAAFSTIQLGLFLAAGYLIANRARATAPITIAACGCAAYLLSLHAVVTETSAAVTALIVGGVLMILSRALNRHYLIALFILGIACCAVAVPMGVETHFTTSAIWLGLASILMIFGFSRKLAFARWTALVLIGITVVKVFLYDLAKLEQGYRILAASVIGVALLAISFTYQRFRLRQG